MKHIVIAIAIVIALASAASANYVNDRYQYCYTAGSQTFCND